MDKTVQMNIRNKNSASKSVFKFDDVSIEVRNLCKYLGIYVDSKSSFQSHIEHIKKRLSKQCGIICKLRHYVPRKQLIDNYQSNVNPIIQYGILVYGCCSYSSLLPIYILQKKILKFIYFRKRSDSSWDIFISNKLLTVFEFHVYELLKFVLKSLKKTHIESYLNELFEYEHSTRNTRRSTKNYLKIPSFKTQFERSSISYRCAKLFNTLRKNEVLAPHIETEIWQKISLFYHKFKESYLLNNKELVSYIFK